MDEAGAAAEAGGAGGSDTPSTDQSGEPSNVTPDGQGGTVSMMDAPTEPSNDVSEEGKMDLKALLGEELAANKTFDKYMKAENPVQEMAKSLIEAQKLIGKPRVGIPPEDAPEEQKAEFYKALGVPEKPEDYGFERPDFLPEDMPYDEEHAAKWAALFKEKNIPADAANELREAFFKEVVETSTAQAEAVNQELNKVLDEAFGEKKDVIAQEVRSVVTEAIKDEGLRQKIEQAVGDENSPAFALALGSVIQHMKQKYGMADSNMNDGSGSSGMTAVDLRAEGKKLMASEAYRNPMHPEHNAVKEKAAQLYRQAATMMDTATK